MELLVLILNKTECLKDILSSFMENGIKGATILDSQGMAHNLYEYNEDGQILKRSDYNEDGELIYYFVYTYDENGNNTSYSAYDSDGTLIDYSTYE